MTEATPGPDLLRQEVRKFTPYTAGLSIDAIRDAHSLDQVYKLASNENPLGVPPLALKAMQRAASSAFRYPRSGNPDLVNAIAAKHNVPAKCIVPGNGSDEIIDLLIRVLCRPGQDAVLTCRPCFSMYELQAKLCGAELRQVPLLPDFTFDWEGLLAQAQQNVKLIFLTSPDNPSGYAPPASQLADFARALPPSCILAIDEAYMDFAQPQEAYSLLPRLEEFPNVAVMRTFSKMYGLAGLRLGFGVCPPWLADHLWRVRLPFSVNLIAEQAGVAALQDDAFIAQTLKTVTDGRTLLTNELQALGFEVLPSLANFILMRPKHQFGMDAANIHQQLLCRGVIIRPMAGYGMPDRLRVSIGNEQENRALLQALRDIHTASNAKP